MIDNQDPRAVRAREKLICAFNEAVPDSDPGKMSVTTGVRCSAPDGWKAEVVWVGVAISTLLHR